MAAATGRSSTTAPPLQAFAPTTATAEPPKVAAPAAEPAKFIELEFVADPHHTYKLWLRLKADNNHWANGCVRALRELLSGGDRCPVPQSKRVHSVVEASSERLTRLVLLTNDAERKADQPVQRRDDLSDPGFDRDVLREERFALGICDLVSPERGTRTRPRQSPASDQSSERAASDRTPRRTKRDQRSSTCRTSTGRRATTTSH